MSVKRLTAMVWCLVIVVAVAAAQGVKCAWGTTDERYNSVEQFPSGRRAVPVLELTAWRGERVNAQFVVMNQGAETAVVSFSASPLTSKYGKEITDVVSGGFVENVIADRYSDCGYHDLEQYGNRPMPDRISRSQATALASGSVMGAWLTLRVPQEAQADTYRGIINITSEGTSSTLSYRLHVVDRVLPPPSEWSFHLDFWQHPYAVARYHDVPLWSQEHFDLMRPIMEELASAGQKVVTATLTPRPWNGQSQDPYGTMVTWMKRIDGTWLYDFTVFDTWVEFMASCGIDRQINCFSMIPWHLSFEYFDQATGQLQEIKCAPGEQAYNDFWGGMLREFVVHLREKGWLEKTTIAMDERQPEQMRQAMDLIKSVAPELKVSLAGNYHPEIESDLCDYCVDYSQIDLMSRSVVERRRNEGLITTFYTCCSTEVPNTFTFSSPAEAELLPWLAAAYGFDGYLRWAFNNWTLTPLLDSRFRSWPSGDTYIIYPFAETSVRWERLVEGVQQYEKWRILGADPKLVTPLQKVSPMPIMSRRMARARAALNK